MNLTLYHPSMAPSFTPFSSLLGGVLIGASASAMLLLSGKIAGISGMVGGLVVPRRGDAMWRLCFLVGLLAGGGLLAALHPSSLGAPSQPLLLTALAGLLVGVGTRVSGGCTSGHGVCGISRLSSRSVVATCTFMVTGAAATFVLEHVLTRSGP